MIARKTDLTSKLKINKHNRRELRLRWKVRTDNSETDAVDPSV